MTKQLDVSLLTTIKGLEALERGPRPRIYANDPRADHDVANFHRQVQRDRNWREDAPEYVDGGERYEDWCEREQGYHGRR